MSLARENCTRRVVSLNGPERVASVTLWKKGLRDWKKGLRDWKRVHLDGWGALGARIHSVTHDNLPHKGLGQGVISQHATVQGRNASASCGTSHVGV